MKVLLVPYHVQCLECRSAIRFLEIYPAPTVVIAECPRCEVQFKYPLIIKECEVVTESQKNQSTG